MDLDFQKNPVLLESLFIDRGLNSGDLQNVPMYFFPTKIQCLKYKVIDRYLLLSWNIVMFWISL